MTLVNRWYAGTNAQHVEVEFRVEGNDLDEYYIVKQSGGKSETVDHLYYGGNESRLSAVSAACAMALMMANSERVRNGYDPLVLT
jgi:hypothetical protein